MVTAISRSGGDEAVFGEGVGPSGVVDTEAELEAMAREAGINGTAPMPTEWDTPLASSASTYIYGFEPLFGDARGPISPDELLLWLKAHTEGINQELSDRMSGADLRAKLVEDLSYLQAQIRKCDKGEEFKAEAQRLLEAYADTGYASALETALKGILENSNAKVSDMEADLINGELQTLIDKLGKDDQMDMIYIQQLTDRLNEQFGFASAYSSKYHDTLMAIIGNLA